MSADSLAFTPAWELAGLIRRRELSPIELVDLFLDRIDRLNPRLNAYLTVTADLAREEARRAEGMSPEGRPLHGIPVSIKDLHFTKGIRTTNGSAAYADFVPDFDHVVVERLKAAGAIILGKTNTSEFGQSGTTENRLGDDCRNPWDTTRTPAGSSGGAGAAVAAGLGPLAVGSDGGGSVRNPAAFCGIFGFKATYGRVPSYGGLGGMPLFSHTGPITRTVRDGALMLSVIAGPDRRDATALREPPPDFLAALDRPRTRQRVAFAANAGGAPIAPEVRSAFVAAVSTFADLGYDLEEAAPDIAEPARIFGPIVCADSYNAIGHLLEDKSELLMPYVRTTLEVGRDLPAVKYARAMRRLERFRADVAEFFDRYDLLLTPVNAVPAFPIGQRPTVIDGQPVDKLWGAFPFSMAFNLTGQPAASVPGGFSSEGLPIGLQIVGRPRDEESVLQAAIAFEAARPWADKRPPVS